MDLTVTSYATFDRLSEYCYRVAGTVGLTCLHVFGFQRSARAGSGRAAGARVSADEYHSRRARAITRWAACTCRRKISTDSACARRRLRGPLTPKIRELLEFEAERAWRFYEEGAPLVHHVDRGQPRDFVGAGANLQQSAGADRRARFRRVLLARFAVERGKSSISPDGADGWLVENGCPRKAFW